MSRMAEQQLYIHGGYTSATSGRTFETINPANGNVLATVQAAGREDVDRAVKSAQQGQKIWASMTAMERSRILRRAVDILRERNDELAKLETLDTGKAYSETSTVDIVTGADVLEYYAGLIPALEGSQIDPRTSTPGLGLLLWMQKVYGDDAPQAWQKLAKKTVTVTKGWSEAYGLFLKGESDLVLSYTTSPAYHILEEKKDNYAAANFSEGHYLQVEVAARTAASKQPELAQKFLQFMVSPAFQNAIPTGNWMYPVANVTLPAGFEKLTKPATTLEFTPAEVAAQRQAWISEWQRAVSR